MRVLRVVNWDTFQHYKDRDPPWIKLHRKVLDNYAWAQLPDASKGHLVGIWLLAARHGNAIPADAVWIANRIGATEPVDIDCLVTSGFVEWSEDGQEDVGKRENWPSRYIPDQVKQAVWKRDAGKCQGCGGRERIEYDHVTPISRGGTSTVENIQLLCAPCNRRKRNKLASAERLAPPSAEMGGASRSLEAETEGETETDKTKAGAVAPETLGAWYGKTLRPVLYPNGGDRSDQERDMHCLKHQFKAVSREELALVVREVRAEVDAGRVPWIGGKGEAFTLRALLADAKDGGISWYERFKAAAYRGETPRKSDRAGGAHSIGDILKGAA